MNRLLEQDGEVLGQADRDAVQQHAPTILKLDPGNPVGLALLDAANSDLEAAETPPLPTTPDKVSQPETHISSSSSFVNGWYQVQKSPGEVGKKMVYLAQDTLLDRVIAFALSAGGLDDVSRTRIYPEAQAMGRPGSHPHIITVFDLGGHEAQPFTAPELMGCEGVEGVLKDAEGESLSLDRAVSMAVGTCRGLGHQREMDELKAALEGDLSEPSDLPQVSISKVHCCHRLTTDRSLSACTQRRLPTAPGDPGDPR